MPSPASVSAGSGPATRRPDPRLVDVSAEEYDNDPTHSGQSLLRGTLSG
ncbi:hypothetical protein [Micromonospora sp. Llam0]|nr:hypothetical protein [Micromonospora sp. Llam0]